MQLDVCHLSRWSRHLVNAYEVKAGINVIAGKIVRSMPERRAPCVYYKRALYKYTYLYLPTWSMHQVNA